jgi:charged multivesicular body protein 1
MTKQLAKESQRSTTDEKAAKSKVKKAIEQGTPDIARIYAETAITKKKEALN